MGPMSAAGIVAFIITLTRDCLADKHKEKDKYTGKEKDKDKDKEKDKDKDKYTGKYKDKDRIAMLNWGFIITLTRYCLVGDVFAFVHKKQEVQSKRS